MMILKHGKIKSMAAFLLLVVFIAIPVSANKDYNTVRVGWHEAPFYYVDQFGRRFGYSYEYQQKVAAYTGWDYEYVEGSWSELLQMLKDGEIDMMANISYTEERAKSIHYASLPMGTETYYVFISPNNSEIISEDYSSLNGKKVGVAKGSIQSELFSQWVKSHNIKVELTELTNTEEESLLMLGGKFDAYVTMDINADPKTAVPVWKIGSSDYYFAVSNKRPDLLGPLNAAMSQIQDENIHFSQQLSDKYLKNTEAYRFLSAEEKEWLENHGTIRVGYQDNYLAFCAEDSATGELTGALKDYLDYASSAFEDVSLNFEAVSYPTASDALSALQNGDIDCMFPANLIASDAEKLGVVMTPPLMTTEMDAVVRASEQKEFVHKTDIRVAVNKGNTNYEMFLIDHYPDWKINYYNDTPTGLDAIAKGDADCVIISYYRYSNIAKKCERLHLVPINTGVIMDYYFAVRKGDTELYSILTRTTAIVSDSAIHAALTYYSTEDARTSIIDNIQENLTVILLSAVLIFLLIIFLLLRSIRAEKRAAEEADTIMDLNKKAFTDALTHVRNKRAYDNYSKQLQERIDQGETIKVAIGVFDCNDLKKINDRYGHDKGDVYLKSCCSLICRVFQHSPVFRIGGDEFVAILINEDYENRNTLLSKFNSEQIEMKVSSNNDWEKVSIASGIAVYDKSIDRNIPEVLRRADKLMYDNKRRQKHH